MKGPVPSSRDPNGAIGDLLLSDVARFLLNKHMFTLFIIELQNIAY